MYVYICMCMFTDTFIHCVRITLPSVQHGVPDEGKASAGRTPTTFRPVSSESQGREYLLLRLQLADWRHHHRHHLPGETGFVSYLPCVIFCDVCVILRNLVCYLLISLLYSGMPCYQSLLYRCSTFVII